MILEITTFESGMVGNLGDHFGIVGKVLPLMRQEYG
jgi:hypothetical protein